MMFLSNVFSMLFQIFCFSKKHDESLVVLSTMLSCFIVCLQATTWLDIELDLPSQMANLVLFRTGLLKCTQHERRPEKTHILNIRGDVFFQVWKAHRFYFQIPSCCLSWADTPGVSWGKVLKIGSKVRVLQSFEAFRMETSRAKALAVFPQKLPENLEGTVVFLHSILTLNRSGKNWSGQNCKRIPSRPRIKLLNDG